jgi:beta-N-acetylhexosaminidase
MQILRRTQFRAACVLRWQSCCLVLLFALVSCSGASSDAGAANSATTTPTAQRSHTLLQPRVDGSDESMLSRELADVQQIMAGMTLDQKLGQLLIVEYLGNVYTAGLQYMIAHQYVGGFLYQASNHNFYPPDNTVASVAAFSRQAMKDAAVPLLIGTDQEGGLVNRLYTFHGYLPSAAQMAATGDPHYAYTQGATDAAWLKQIGINADLAPVVDVQTVSPPVLQTRMFGSTPSTVATFATAFLNGLQQNSVIGCLKHFPGLGAITSDPHAGLPVVNRSLADLENIDLAPYRLMLQQDHPAMVMSTDVLVPAIDPLLPAELSPKTITGVLRQQLGYNGVVITDGLYMGGIIQRWSLPEAAVLSIIAGDDLVEGPFSSSQVAAVIAAFKQALQQGRLTMARIDQSVERILLMKVRYGIITVT